MEKEKAKEKESPLPAVPAKLDDGTKTLAQMYPLDKYNLLLPTRTIQEQISPLHKPKIEIVQLQEEEIYQISSGSDQWGIHHSGLQKFAAAIGLNTPGEKNRLIMDDGIRVTFQATGECRRNDGTWQEYSRTYTLDLDELLKGFIQSYTKKADRCLADHKKGGKDLPWGLTENTRQKWIDEQVERDMAQKRKFRVQLSETGAMHRVIKDIVVLRSGYKKAEIMKPFVMLRIVFSPDQFMKDPRAQGILIGEAVKASGMLYGGQETSHRILPAQSSTPVPDAEVMPIGENGNGHPETPPPPAEAKPAPAAPPPATAAETKTAPASVPPAPEKENGVLPTEEEFITWDAKEQAETIKKLMNAVKYDQLGFPPLKKPKIDEWEQKHRTGFFEKLCDLYKKKEADDQPY